MSGFWQQEEGACEKLDADRVQATRCSQHLTLTHFFLLVDEFEARLQIIRGRSGFESRPEPPSPRRSGDGQSALYFGRLRRAPGPSRPEETTGLAVRRGAGRGRVRTG